MGKEKEDEADDWKDRMFIKDIKHRIFSIVKGKEG
jgi:hypothetical protein